MSTRSGKRIHSSLHENTNCNEVEIEAERKTRRKRLKQNENTLETTVRQSTKRGNYVSYPTDEETAQSAEVVKPKTDRKLRRNTLKDHNNIETDSPRVQTSGKANKMTVRETRQTKKFVEEVTESTENKVEFNGRKKSKKNKKKTSELNIVESPEKITETTAPVDKKSKKKKKGKKKSVEVITGKKLTKSGSNISTDSFHSAAGSPMHKKHNPAVEQISTLNITASELTTDEKINASYDKTLTSSPGMNNAFEIDDNKRKSCVNIESIKLTIEEKANITFKNTVTSSPAVNNTFEIDDKRKSSINIKSIEPTTTEKINITFENTVTSSPTINNTFEIDDNKRKSSLKSNIKTIQNNSISSTSSVGLNSTYDKKDIENMNTTYEKKEVTRSSSNQNSNSSVMDNSNILNNTYKKRSKSSKSISLSATFDKSASRSLVTSPDAELNSKKSSLISTDSYINITLDKSDSRISITSDESVTNAGNIVNTTPLLIESSLDETKLSDSQIAEPEALETDSIPSVKDPEKSLVSENPAETPLKREGTFTKDGPDAIIVSPKPRISLERTPSKIMSLPTAGETPFHLTRSLQRGGDKGVLNVTRSLEKSTRMSLAEAAPRQTKVMFCSPTNSPTVVAHHNKKIIKSSMKGSNKSFVFDESVTSSRPASRKRSWTHNDVDSARAKRNRLGDELQQSVDRLSRPRNNAGVARPPPSTPHASPWRTRSEVKRTRLPDFKALHQQQFSRMESLDECQRRHARRARRLLTPSGAGAKLSSPRDPVSLSKETKKSENQPKPPVPPTLESLRPGYTRFGFKLTTSVGNPFPIPNNENTESSKTMKENNREVFKERKEKYASQVPEKKKEKRNGTIAKSMPTIDTNKSILKPSTSGATDRKEFARQVIMREKSSLSVKRDTKRKENRTIIKGVRTNRRFELQMQMRNID